MTTSASNTGSAATNGLSPTVVATPIETAETTIQAPQQVVAAKTDDWMQ